MQMPFIKAFCCWPFLFVKEWLRNLLSRFFVAGLFFLSKNGSETFCQGSLLQAISFCQSVAQKPFVKVFCCRPFLFVKEWLRNLLSRPLPFCQGLQGGCLQKPYLAKKASTASSRVDHPYLGFLVIW